MTKISFRAKEATGATRSQLTIINIISIAHLGNLRRKRYVLSWRVMTVYIFYFAVKNVPRQRHD